VKINLDFVSISEVDEELIEKIRNWRNQPKIRKYMYNNHIISKKEHKKWIRKVKNNDETKVWIVYQDETPIGVMNLKDIDHKNKITDWGFYIGEEKYRGLGLSKHMLYNLMKLVFADMNFRKMYTTVLENNEIALNLYKKMGLEIDGCLKDHLIRDNRLIDLYLMSVFEKKWRRKKSDLKNKYELKEYDLE